MIMARIIVHQLNMSWTVAAEKALSNSLLFPAIVSDTIVFVTDVPMLDPKMIGTASCGSRTENKDRFQSILSLPNYGPILLPPPTMEMTIEVKVELL